MNRCCVKWATLVMITFLTGCSVITPYQLPALKVPAAWKQTTASSRSTPTPPQQPQLPSRQIITFENAQLSHLIDRAIVDNYELRAALQRIEQARAVLQVNQANRWFALDAGGQISATASKPKTVNDTAYRANVDMAYEVDLWGRNRALRQAAQQRLQASLSDHSALQLIMTSDLSAAYVNWLATQERLTVAQYNLHNAREVLSIVAARFKEGAISALELRQQETSVANARAAIASLQRSLETYHHQLAVLSGQAPAQFMLQRQRFAHLHYQPINTLTPQRVLAHRPDLQAAEAQLRAANMDVAVARAALFPDMNLGISAVISASPISASALRTLMGVASTTAPIFHGGALRAEWRRTQARKQEWVEQYAHGVIVAFQEVEDALAFRRAAHTRLRDRTGAAKAAAEAYHLSRERFDAGAIDFQTLLDTQRDRFQAEDALIQARQDIFLAEINVYKAIGG